MPALYSPSEPATLEIAQEPAPVERTPIWNWKAGLLSAIFRVAAFAVSAPPHDAAGMRGVWIQLIFRIALGGFWGSLMQALREVAPGAMTVNVILMAAAGHLLEYFALKYGHASHIKTGIVVSIIISTGSLLINWGLMRRGLLLAGAGSETLLSDFRNLPRALASVFLTLSRAGARLFGLTGGRE